MKSGLIYNFLDDDELLRISNRIKKAEKKTSGEICVSIKEYLPWYKKNKSIRSIAEEEFFKLGINKTRDKTGTLIFLLLEKRQFYILADSGINEKVQQSQWDKIKDEIQEMFSKGKFCTGILHGIDEVGEILSSQFPIKKDDTNEISNRVIID